MKNIQQELLTELNKKSQWLGLAWFMGFILFVLPLTIWGMFIIDYLSKIEIFKEVLWFTHPQTDLDLALLLGLGFLSPIIYLISFWAIIHYLVILSKSYIRQLIKTGKMLNATYSSELSIDDIIDKNRKLRSNINSLLRTRKYFFWISKDIKVKLKEYVDTLLLEAIATIHKFRSDLVTRLAEQRSALESAKTEVEKNITGTPELLAVSEAQQVRLDRQIEQFEELQRVLVKV
jgi:hypothetical protein